jgi:hypothetical protein
LHSFSAQGDRLRRKLRKAIGSHWPRLHSFS